MALWVTTHLETSHFMVRMTRDNTAGGRMPEDCDKQYPGGHHAYSSSWNKKDELNILLFYAHKIDVA